MSRHQDRLGKGNALAELDHFDDYDLIMDVGANSVRLAHYQQDGADERAYLSKLQS